MRQCLGVGWQENAIFEATGGCAISPRLHLGARRVAHRLAGERVVHIRTSAGHAVEVGGQIERVAMHAGGVPALLITEQDDDVGV